MVSASSNWEYPPTLGNSRKKKKGIPRQLAGMQIKVSEVYYYTEKENTYYIHWGKGFCRENGGVRNGSSLTIGIRLECYLIIWIIINWVKDGNQNWGYFMGGRWEWFWCCNFGYFIIVIVILILNIIIIIIIITIKPFLSLFVIKANYAVNSGGTLF